jgi:hypothetical protein
MIIQTEDGEWQMVLTAGRCSELMPRTGKPETRACACLKCKDLAYRKPRLKLEITYDVSELAYKKWQQC